MFREDRPGTYVGLGAIVAIGAGAVATGQWGYLAVVAVTVAAGAVGGLDLRRTMPDPLGPVASPAGHDLLAIIGPDGTLRQVSGSMGDALALPTGRLFGVDVMRLVHPEDRGRLVGMVIEAEQAGESETFRLRFVRGDKTWTAFDVWALAMPEAAAGLGGAVIIGRLVPEGRKRTPAARRAVMATAAA